MKSEWTAQSPPQAHPCSLRCLLWLLGLCEAQVEITLWIHPDSPFQFWKALCNASLASFSVADTDHRQMRLSGYMSALPHFGKGALSVEPVWLWAVGWCGFVNGAHCGSVGPGSMTQLPALSWGGCLVIHHSQPLDQAAHITKYFPLASRHDFS